MNDIDKYGQYTVDNWFSSDEDPSPLRALAIMSLGLAGESGEVCEKIKKFIRDGNDDMELLKKELGDVIFYWARICRYFDMVPSDVIATNIKKLDDRRSRGVTRGSGDNR
jgi:NTP pyrophosphatase (non-canonical NTP hydrolase)